MNRPLLFIALFIMELLEIFMNFLLISFIHNSIYSWYSERKQKNEMLMPITVIITVVYNTLWFLVNLDGWPVSYYMIQRAPSLCGINGWIKILYVRGVIKYYFQISWATYVGFSHFYFVLSWYACQLYMLTISAILDCQFGFWQIKPLVVLFDFLLFERIYPRNCIKFCVKI